MTLLEAAKAVVDALGSAHTVYIGSMKRRYEATFDPDHDPVDALRAAIEQGEREAAPYEKFGRLVVENIRNQPHWWEDEWSTEIMPLAVDAGLAEYVPYDPELHGSVEAEPGEEIWVWTP